MPGQIVFVPKGLVAFRALVVLDFHVNQFFVSDHVGSIAEGLATKSALVVLGLHVNSPDVPVVAEFGRCNVVAPVTPESSQMLESDVTLQLLLVEDFDVAVRTGIPPCPQLVHRLNVRFQSLFCCEIFLALWTSGKFLCLRQMADLKLGGSLI